MKPIILAALLAAAAPAAAQFSLASSVDGWTPLPPVNQVQLSTPAAPGAGWTVFSYAIDDGSSENGLGLSTGGNLVFLQRFNATKGADTITVISAAWGTPTKSGSSPAAGSSVTVYLWNDPNDDGNPVDGVLLRQRTVSLQNPETDIKQKIAITPTVVTGTFFVGAKINHVQGQFPGALDYSKNSIGRSWVTGSSGGYSGTPVTGGVGLFDLGALPHQGVWLLGAEGVGYVSVSYCTAKVNSLGCTPAITSTGAPNASTSTSGFNVRCTQVRNNKSGMLFYRVGGTRANVAFQCGTLCVGPGGIKRTLVQSAGGNPAPANDCSGVFALDMNAFANGLGGGNPDPGLKGAGNTVRCQWWGRDQGFAPPCNTMFSDGLEYIVQ